MTEEQPRRVIPPAANPTPAAKAATVRSRPSPAKDFPPLAMIVIGFLFGAVGGAMLVLDSFGLNAAGVVIALLGQVLLLIGVVAQGVYIGTAKARDRGY